MSEALFNLMTIGFTKTSAESFFTRLRQGGVKTLVDVRLNNVSQLAGFAKAGDLPYFLRELCGIEYRHEPLLAPEDAMLKAYRSKQLSWTAYEVEYLNLLVTRDVANRLDRQMYQASCLLCSEDKPHHCHRRVAAEYLAKSWGIVTPITHL